MPSTFYVKPNGNDTRDGLSDGNAWQSIDRVNQQRIQPGDTVRFQGGGTYFGSLGIFGIGDPNNPITVTSYGTGRATIASGAQRGIWADGGGGYHIRNLNFVGDGVDANGLFGIDLSNIHLWVGPAANMVIEDVEVSGYGGAGISISADSVYGIDNVSIVGADVHDNANGITVGNGYGSYIRAISNLYIAYVNVHHNDRHFAPVAGFGINLENISGGLVERSLIWENGTVSTSPGHVGFYLHDSDNVLVQFNESHHNSDAANMDGQGFLLDQVTDCVVQYNYSHDNAAQGFDLRAHEIQYASLRNTFRYNVSENDQGGLSVLGPISDARFYNNTVFAGPGGFRSAATVGELYGSGVYFWNNIFQTAGESLMVMVDQLSLITGSDIIFQQNAYYRGGGPLPAYITWGDTSWFSLVDWQNATGQEMMNGVRVGYNDDPYLISPGGGGTIGNPDWLLHLSAYGLRDDSPLRDWGLDLRQLYSINPGIMDYYGNLLSQDSPLSMGAHQTPSVTTPGGPTAPGVPFVDLSDELDEVTDPILPIEPAAVSEPAPPDVVDAPAAEQPLVWSDSPVPWRRPHFLPAADPWALLQLSGMPMKRQFQNELDLVD